MSDAALTTPSKHLRGSHWMVLLAAFSGWMFDGMEMGLFPVIARPALQDLMGVTSDAEVLTWNGRIVALFLVGAAFGGFIFGWLGDKLGRVRTMMLSIITYSFFTGCCYFAGAPWHLGAFRFLAALGMGGEWALGVALVMEYWPENLRPLLAGVIGAAANVGFLFIAVVGRMIPVTVDSWRWMFLVGAVPALLTIFIRLFVPESERWKESVKETGSKPVREIFSSNLLKPTLLAICFASIALIGTWGSISGFLPVWSDKLASGQAELVIAARIADPPPVQIDETVSPLAVTDPGIDGPIYVANKRGSFAEPPNPGDRFSYTITVANTGTKVGNGVTYTDFLPIRAIHADSVTIDDPHQATFDPKDGKVVWSIGELPPADAPADPPPTRSLTITMTVAENPKSGIDVSVNRVAIADATEGRNFAYTIQEKDDLEGKPQAGQKVNLTITVANKTEMIANGVHVTNRLPLDAIDPASVRTSDPENVTFNKETGDLTWSIPEIKPKNPFAKATNQIVISIGAIIGCLIAPLIGGRIGRRPAYFALCVASLLICQFLYRELSEYNLLFIVTTGVAGCLTASFYGWLPLYLPELFPTRVRATGQGLSFNFGRILAAVGALYAGQLGNIFEHQYPGQGYAMSGATITLVYLIGMVLIWFAPETKGKPLPE